jgi:hypothetical protein
MTRTVKFLLYIALLACLSAAGAQAPAPANDQSADSNVEEEIVVRGVTRASLRVQIELAEDAVYERWNEINGNDEFDIHCRLDTYTGSRIPHRVCQPNFWRAALAESGKETVRGLQGSSYIAAAVFQGEAMAKSRTLEKEMKRIAGEDTELLQAVSRFYSLTTRLDNLNDEDSSDDATTFRVVTAAEQTLPYDAAVMAEVRVRAEPWRHILSHETFAIAHVYGEIEGLELDCRKQSRQLNFESGAEWSVPAGWQPCSVIVEAGRGTTFSLYEFE